MTQEPNCLEGVSIWSRSKGDRLAVFHSEDEIRPWITAHFQAHPDDSILADIRWQSISGRWTLAEKTMGAAIVKELIANVAQIREAGRKLTSI
jgi:hypothetical protein